MWSALAKSHSGDREPMNQDRRGVSTDRSDPYGADLQPGERALAPYAASRVPSRGRRFAEPPCPTRSPLQRDRDRILHSTAFRRLTYKTQMFVFHEGDHYRTRLTHSLEVAQIARTIARQLRLDEDLAEALSLAHDLGHPPFGHAGERALDEVLQDCGGFDHNIQSFRLVTKLERKYPAFDGLNLTWETLEGLVKHNGPPALGERSADKRLEHALRDFEGHMRLFLDQWASAEAQVAAISDDIAWMTHDIDDGLRAGLIGFDDLKEVPLIAAIIGELDRTPALDGSRRIYGVTRQLITVMIRDAVDASRMQLARLRPQHPDDIRRAQKAVVVFSDTMRSEIGRLHSFLFARLYRSPRVARVMDRAGRLVRDLVARYRREPEAMPEAWRAAASSADERQQARLVADFVAGMTDRFAMAEHRRLFDATPELR
jgi:dGTPase